MIIENVNGYVYAYFENCENHIVKVWHGDFTERKRKNFENRIRKDYPEIEFKYKYF